METASFWIGKKEFELIASKFRDGFNLVTVVSGDGGREIFVNSEWVATFPPLHSEKK